jgi:dipeptidyl aminopeptidase/acylaminoacyl peptidase
MTATLYDRRRVLIGAGALGTTLSLPRPSSAAPELAPRRLFFDDPEYSAVRISPDGRMIAYLAPLDGVRNLWLAPLADLGAARPLTRATDRSLSTFFAWAYDNRRIVFYQDHQGDECWRASCVDVSTGEVIALTPAQGVNSYRQEASRHFPTEMLLAHNERDHRYFDIYRVDLLTGRSTLVFENHEFSLLVTDSRFRLRMAGRYAADGHLEFLERRGARWIPFDTVPLGDVDTTRPLEFSDDGRTLYLFDSRERDRPALVAIDTASRRKTILAEDAGADVTAALFHPRSRHPLAAAHYAARLQWQALTPMAAAAVETLTRYAPGDLEFFSRSDDNRWHIVYYGRDTSSGEYVLYDARTRAVRPLFQQRPRLAQVRLRPLTPVSFAARDGLALNGYLTLPAAGERALPLVLLIHGGPYWRDLWGFEPTHQWLANRGYAVLSVNYRGSTGYGKAFVAAADHEWGGKMQDDVIDGVNWAIGQGIADATRVGFIGASYGGYAGLTALTRTPEVFACVVDLFGISNLLTFMAAIPAYWKSWFSVWKQRLGDPDTEEGRAFLRERSPLTHIDRAARPILIAQGLQDVRVTRAESEQIVAALQARAVPVTYVTFADEGHGFVRQPNRLAFNAVAEAFLAKHLGGAFEPVGDDFAGSTLKVEAGGEFVPGLASAVPR